MNFAYTVTEQGISFFLDGKSFVVGRDHANFDKIKETIKAREFDKIEALMDLNKGLHDWVSTDPEFFTQNGLIFYKGEAFEDAVSGKALAMLSEDLDPAPILNFLRKTRENPSATAQRELLLFCVANGFLIHEDGDVLAFKGVREDYLDVHSGSVDNSIGKIVEMPRSQVDDRRNVTCSFGLHFAAHDFAKSWGARVVVLKINPSDVVSIPEDYNNQKGRCCRYEVIAELERPEQPPAPKQVYKNSDIVSVRNRVRKVIEGVFVGKKGYVPTFADTTWLDDSALFGDVEDKDAVLDELTSALRAEFATELEGVLPELTESVDALITRISDSDELLDDGDDDDDDYVDHEADACEDQDTAIDLRIRNVLASRFDAITPIRDVDTFDDLDINRSKRTELRDLLEDWYGVEDLDEIGPETTVGEVIQNVIDAVDEQERARTKVRVTEFPVGTRVWLKTLEGGLNKGDTGEVTMISGDMRRVSVKQPTGAVSLWVHKLDLGL